MAQSVELLLDPAAEATLVGQWSALRGVGLPSELRAPGDELHRPHITLYAGDRVEPAAEAALPALMSDLNLQVTVGALMVFGPRRDRYIVVRQVVPSVELLTLQQRVVRLCRFPLDNFAAGTWTPHITLARRASAAQVASVLELLGRAGGAPLASRIRDCRRWDGARKVAWSLT